MARIRLFEQVFDDRVRASRSSRQARFHYLGAQASLPAPPTATPSRQGCLRSQASTFQLASEW